MEPPMMKGQKETKARILIVDDDRIILESLGEFLQLEGYEVEAATSFAEAVRVLEPQPVDLMICDVNMPNMDGLEMLAQVKQRGDRADLPIVMLTTEGKARLMKQAKENGAKGWLVKPFEPENLQGIAKRLAGVVE